uniref:Uncharacterized protein LOC102806216 n=1 Tax=Saccoglossus kowalevskii TaxID=10224 RepID=A0ABM0MLI5_SACKO|nr:PREDICTED: uncharacterized protein LOC102806216 [Saccoglossus kowalevskii]
MCPSGVQPYKDDQNMNALCSVAIGVDSILTQTCPRGFYCNMITSSHGVCCPLKLDDVCYYNGVAYPVGGTVIWGCALCQCRDGGFVCLYPPGLICDPSEPICPNGDDYYTSTGTDVNFCTLPLDAPLGLTQGDCPADYFCHPLDLGYSICCPAISGDCVVNGVLIPNGGVILMPDCVLWWVLQI